ncbi:MAG: transcription elongation factor GreAB [Proteobacteria bacterium]|nr:transcription elongation factor GreAB [Pseudomonadota bacterium]
MGLLSRDSALDFKKKIISSLLEDLESKLKLLTHAAHEAHVAATHEESKAEDKYDTRGLEASYLAGAQAKRALEIKKQIESYKFLPINVLADNAPIQITALVEAEYSSKKQLFFIVPQGGGLILDIAGLSFQIVTPISKIGEELVGRFLNDSFETEINGQNRVYKITQVF